jgi:hypothetical protein
MIPRILLLSTVLFSALPAADPEPKSAKARAIASANLPGGLARYDDPQRFATEKELAVRVPEAAQRAAILKQIDFEREHLVLFSWTGSGGDKITPVEGKVGEATFDYTAGFTDDIARHARLFAIPAKATVKVTLGKP